jgi:hypothetical protein
MRTNKAEQNKYLVAVLFDGRAQYVFHERCIVKVTKISRRRLLKMKLALTSPAKRLPVQKKAKDLMAAEIKQAKKTNRGIKRLQRDTLVNIPPATHGLQGRPSNFGKPDLVAAFVTFVLGAVKSTDRTKGTTYMLDARLMSLTGQKHWLSLQGELNKYISPRSVSHDFVQRYFRELFSHCCLAGHLSDYCDTCANLKKECKRLTCKVQAARNNPSVDISEPLQHVLAITLENAAHRETVYEEESCARIRREKLLRDCGLMETLHNLTLKTAVGSAEVDMELQGPTRTRHVKAGEKIAPAAAALLEEEWPEYTFAITFDYTADLYIPWFGTDPQPTTTYFRSKLKVSMAGLMAHNKPLMLEEGRLICYWYYESELGPKNADHVLSIILRLYLPEGLSIWMRSHLKNLVIFMDGAPATNKSQGVIRGLMFHVGDTSENVDRVEVVYTVSGHSKCILDMVLSLLKKPWREKKCNIFTTRAIQEACESVKFETHQVLADDVLNYRDATKPSFDNIIGVSAPVTYIVSVGKARASLPQFWTKMTNVSELPLEMVDFEPNETTRKAFTEAIKSRLHSYDKGVMSKADGLGSEQKIEYPVDVQEPTLSNSIRSLYKYLDDACRSEDPWPALLAMPERSTGALRLSKVRSRVRAIQGAGVWRISWAMESSCRSPTTCSRFGRCTKSMVPLSSSFLRASCRAWGFR